MKSVLKTALLSLALLSLLAAGPTTREAAAEKLIGAAEIYAEPNSALGIKTLMGRRVQVEVVVTIARDTPLVEIVKPADRDKAQPIQAHLVSLGIASELKKDQRVLITGIIVDEGYSAYMIYVHEIAKAK